MAKSYIYVVIGVGLAVIAASFWELFSAPPGTEWVLLAALTLLTGSFTVKLPSLDARISVSETFVFTSVLLFGPAAGTVTVVLDSLVASLWLKHANRRLSRMLFNAAAPSIAIWLSSRAFFFMAHADPSTIRSHSLATLLAPLFLFALLYFAINTGLVAGALATQSSESPLRIWLKNFPSVSITYFVGASIAILIVAYTPRLDLSVLGIILPLLLISYLTFRTSLGRLDDANRHVAQMNELYLSTIETLAMAVDAKDQITHGHIRRVQVFATELARRLGINDERQLQAIQAAALLHDLGKLAIPEYILNKPGKLNDAEFTKMKRHAAIGADLLSSITFPYPVVPIVRHHHENWDGSGYPTGIAGTDIPLGARILSVVDCFDALTSDRPYRPRLSPEKAFQILTERRGNMYDPLVVDAFIAAYDEIAPLAKAAGQQAKTIIPGEYFEFRALYESAATTQSSHPEDESVIAEVIRSVSSTTSLPAALDCVAQLMPTEIPGESVALLLSSDSDQTITCIRAVGSSAGVLEGLTIPWGERISGWAIANATTVYNSDPALDLGQLAKSQNPQMKSALSVPLIIQRSPIGVLTFYSSSDEAFTQRHGFIIEQIAPAFGAHLRSILARYRPAVVTFPESADRRNR